VNNIQQVIDKPQGAYTAHTAIRWHPNDMKVAPDTKIHCRAVVSLDGDLSQAADVYSAEWIKPTEPVDYHYFGPVQTQGLFETAMVFTAGPKGAAIEVVFYDALGMPMQESSNYALAPHCRLSEPQLKVPQGAGTVEVVSDQPVHIYALVRHVSLDRTEISYIADYRLEQV
jgi:hypothetical protein